MGSPISALTVAELPLREGDLLEVSRERADEPGVYDSFSCPASAASVVQATTTIRGILELATDAEAIAGVDVERGITPAALEAALLNVLENRIIAGDGVTVDFSGGNLTLGLA